MRGALAFAGALAVIGCDIGYDGERLEERSVEEVGEIQVVDLSAPELSALLTNGNVRLIDVRRDDEVALGIIPGAEHIMLDDFDPALLDFSDGREIVLYCRSGRRSRIAGERLSAFTGQPAKHLSGGILAWQEANHEVEIPSPD